MSQAINSDTVPGPVQALYAPVKDELVAAEAVFRDALHSESPFVDDLLQYGGQAWQHDKCFPSCLKVLLQQLVAVHLCLSSSVQKVVVAKLLFFVAGYLFYLLGKELLHLCY